MNFSDSIRKQMSNGLIPHYAANSQIAFQDKLNELHKEIQNLERALNRLQQASRKTPRPANITGQSRDIRVVYEDVENEMATVHGWILSMVETMFTLVRLELGPDEAMALRAQWRRYF